MAFKNAAFNLQVAMNPIYTCPVGKEAVVHSIFATPLVATTTVSIQFTDSGLTSTSIGKEVPLVFGGSLYYPKPLNLKAGESIDASCLVNNDVDFVISVLEKDVV